MILFDGEVEMRGELLVEVGISDGLVEEGTHAGESGAQEEIIRHLPGADGLRRARGPSPLKDAASRRYRARAASGRYA